MHHNNYIKDIVDKYEENFGECQSFPMPGYPGKALLKAEGEPEQLTEYRLLVGKLLFAMKKTYPELANPMHELATHMDTPGLEHWKSIGQMIGYLKHEAVHGLQFNILKDMAIVGCVDSDFATNKETRKSTTEYLVLLGGCLVSWSSKAQLSVTLRSTCLLYTSPSPRD